jgi:hypothetical protein
MCLSRRVGTSVAALIILAHSIVICACGNGEAGCPELDGRTWREWARELEGDSGPDVYSAKRRLEEGCHPEAGCTGRASDSCPHYLAWR